MKKTITLLMLLSVVTGIFSQKSVEVSMGAGYANEVYYSMESGTLKSSARTNWDIAFVQSQRGVSVLANNGADVELYTYTNGAIADWSSVDTASMTWTALYNSIDTWETGAFNTYTNLNYQAQVYDYGWGVYNTSNHNVVGDSIYIIKLTDGSYKKFAIEKKVATANTWYFKYADLDGSNAIDTTFDADDYSTTYIHYSIANNEFVDQESESRWQLLFTKYYDYTYQNGYGYNMTGILSNDGVYVQEVASVDTASDSYDATLFNSSISTIGYDWKTLNHSTFQYVISDSLVYFVCDSLDGTDDHPVYKIIITDFAGSSTGTFTFTQEKLSETSGIEGINSSSVSKLAVYPNPATDQITFNQNIDGNVEVSVYSLEGKLVLSQNISACSGKNLELGVSSLNSGMYNVVVRANNEVYSTRFIKE